MKKLLISLLLSSSTLFATSMTMANTKFSAPQMAQIQLSALTFKDVMRQFYNGQMSRAFVQDEEISKMLHIALGQVDKDGETTVALMHPIMSYINSSGEPRYLVIIEKIKVSSEGNLVSCHACAATADLYSFKELQNGHFQLVSRSPKDAEFSASWGRVGLDVEEISKNMQPLGKNLVGSLFQNGYTSTGVTETWWEALHLPEDDFINTYGVADAGSDNSSSYEEGSPLIYSYEGTLEVIDNGARYYPIKVTYVGEKPTEDYEQIHQVNYSETVSFDPIKKEYK